MSLWDDTDDEDAFDNPRQPRYEYDDDEDEDNGWAMNKDHSDSLWDSTDEPEDEEET